MFKTPVRKFTVRDVSTPPLVIALVSLCVGINMYLAWVPQWLQVEDWKISTLNAK